MKSSDLIDWAVLMKSTLIVRLSNNEIGYC